MREENIPYWPYQMADTLPITLSLRRDMAVSFVIIFLACWAFRQTIRRLSPVCWWATLTLIADVVTLVVLINVIGSTRSFARFVCTTLFSRKSRQLTCIRAYSPPQVRIARMDFGQWKRADSTLKRTSRLVMQAFSATKHRHFAWTLKTLFRFKAWSKSNVSDFESLQ